MATIDTFTFKPLPKDAVQQWTAVITECWAHVWMHSKPMRQINFESFSQILAAPVLMERKENNKFIDSIRLGIRTSNRMNSIE